MTSGFVNRFLCWEAFAPLARLSFVVYLTHDLVINQFAAYVAFPVEFTFLWWVSKRQLIISSRAI